MTRLRRHPIALRWFALIAILAVASTLAWDPPSSDHVTAQIALYFETAFILLWSGTEVISFCRETARKKTLHRRTTAADSAGAVQLSQRNSRFLAPDVQKRFEPGGEAANVVTLPLLSLAGKTVLIADDDFEITQSLVMRFERLGMTALRTADAVQIFFGVHKVKADLVVLDVNMPTGNGLVICGMLNRNESLASLPIIVYTGCSSEATMARCRALGAYYVLKAPHSWSAIERIVYHLFCPGQKTSVAPDRKPHETTVQAEPAPAMSSPDRPPVA
jgi:CheY-like chemotaxis protein